MENKQIAKIFQLTGQLLELHDENEFKVKSFGSAAFKISRLPQRLADVPPDELEKVEGIGKNHAGRIRDILSSGITDDLRQLLEITPAGVVQMLNIKGIGPKKVALLWKELGIESVGELLYACNENRLVELKGFGAKTQELVRSSIEFSQENQHKYFYATLEARADVILNLLNTVCKQVSYTGAFRRKCEILENIEFLAEGDREKIIEAFNNNGYTLEESQEGQLNFRAFDEVPVIVYLSLAEDFYPALFRTTSTKEHIQLLNIKIPAKAGSEQEIYMKNLNLPYFEPELREGLFEKQWLMKGDLPALVNFSDIKGVLHNHTTYSDGSNSVLEMAKYCKDNGFSYLGICDHSQSAYYAGGLKPDRILQQQQEIDQVNKTLGDFRILKGIESDILSDGSLDYPEEILKTFDLVVASVHSNLKMNEEKAMMRLLKAIENPYTTILGHATGRLLLSRAGYPIDHKKIIDACAANEVIIELNANPYRLDMDWRYLPYALEKGVMISVNPDAHKKETIFDMQYGIYAARKGGLTKDMLFNAMSLEQMLAYLDIKA